jgi:hypothetical protein
MTESVLFSMVGGEQVGLHRMVYIAEVPAGRAVAVGGATPAAQHIAGPFQGHSSTHEGSSSLSSASVEGAIRVCQYDAP